jgi:hypothetical protein
MTKLRCRVVTDHSVSEKRGSWVAGGSPHPFELTRARAQSSSSRRLYTTRLTPAFTNGGASIAILNRAVRAFLSHARLIPQVLRRFGFAQGEAT